MAELIPSGTADRMPAAQPTFDANAADANRHLA